MAIMACNEGDETPEARFVQWFKEYLKSNSIKAKRVAIVLPNLDALRENFARGWSPEEFNSLKNRESVNIEENPVTVVFQEELNYDYYDILIGFYCNVRMLEKLDQRNVVEVVAALVLPGTDDWIYDWDAIAIDGCKKEIDVENIDQTVRSAFSSLWIKSTEDVRDKEKLTTIFRFLRKGGFSFLSNLVRRELVRLGWKREYAIEAAKIAVKISKLKHIGKIDKLHYSQALASWKGNSSNR